MKRQQFTPSVISYEVTSPASFHRLAGATRDTGNPAEPVFVLDPPRRNLQIFSEGEDPLAAVKGLLYGIAAEMLGCFGVLIGAGVFVLLLHLLMHVRVRLPW